MRRAIVASFLLCAMAAAGDEPRLGRAEVEDSVAAGLRWLAAHQDVDRTGGWDADEFMKHDPPGDRCEGPGRPQHDVGVTGLALLAFLGAGCTDRGSARENPYAGNVRQGLRYLMTVQDEDGCFGPRTTLHFFYDHAIATAAMTEAYGMTRHPLYKESGQKGIDFIAAARNPDSAWRYEPRGGDNDTSVTGWCLIALKSARFAGLETDPEAFAGARRWIEKMTDPETGRVGYNRRGGPPARPEGLHREFPSEKSESMTAAGVLGRFLLGEDRSLSPMIEKGADLMAQRLPEWDPDGGAVDMHYWFYGTLAMFQVGGDHWRKWSTAMAGAVVANQHGEDAGSKAGSWDPVGPWGADGGRVYSTALMVMCCAVFYRYDKVFDATR